MNDLLNNLNSAANRSVDFKDDLANGFDSSSDQVHIHIVGVVLQLIEHALCILIIGDLDQNIDFLQFDVDWVVEFAEEHLDIVFKDRGLLLEHEADVA